MAVNARTEEFQHIEVFDKPALFTNGRIARDTVPKGWYCYDIRGSDDDPGELCYMEENVVVNHAGSVLMPEKLAIPKSGRLDVRDELGFLDEGDMTLREFCEAHQLPYPAENMKFHIRPARPEEAGLFYTPHPEEDKRLGTVGHVRMDFGRSGNEFWHTWWPRGPEELNSPTFKLELQEVVDTLRESVLKSRFAMERFCYDHGGKISGGWTQNYGYIVETEHYRYCLRCNPSPGDYNGYLTVYDLAVQRQNMARDKPLVGRVSYELIRCVRLFPGDAQGEDVLSADYRRSGLTKKNAALKTALDICLEALHPRFLLEPERLVPVPQRRKLREELREALLWQGYEENYDSAIRSVFVGGVGWISPQDVKKQRHLPLVLSYRVDGMSKDGAYLSLELEPWEYDLLLEQTKNHYKNKEKRNTK